MVRSKSADHQTKNQTRKMRPINTHTNNQHEKITHGSSIKNLQHILYMYIYYIIIERTKTKSKLNRHHHVFFYYSHGRSGSQSCNITQTSPIGTIWVSQCMYVVEVNDGSHVWLIPVIGILLGASLLVEYICLDVVVDMCLYCSVLNNETNTIY